MKEGANVMHLNPRQFDLMKCNSKTLEIRTLDEKRKRIKVGDVVYFLRESQRPQVLKTIVTGIDTFSSFDEVYSAFDPAALGFRGATLMEFLETMYEIYSDAREYECGVVVFHVEVAKE